MSEGVQSVDSTHLIYRHEPSPCHRLGKKDWGRIVICSRDRGVCVACEREVGQTEKKGEVKCRHSIFSRGAIVSWLGGNEKGEWLAKLSFLSKPKCTIAPSCTCKSTYRCTRSPLTHTHTQTRVYILQYVRDAPHHFIPKTSPPSHGWNSSHYYDHYSGADLISLWFIADSSTVSSSSRSDLALRFGGLAPLYLFSVI